MIIPPKKILPLNKINWKPVTAEDAGKLFSDVNINHELLGNLTVDIKETNYEQGIYKLMLTIKDKLKNLLGFEILSLDKNKKEMFGYNIKVNPECRRKGLRLGELLRTFSILEMAENKITKFEIYSKEEAVYFHSKYKFEPSNKTFKNRDTILMAIADEAQEGFEIISQKAKDLLTKILSPSADAQKQREYCQQANVIIKEYIEKSLTESQPEVSHPFYYGFDMILTEKQLHRNKDFYNRLFNKYGIDYKI